MIYRYITVQSSGLDSSELTFDDRTLVQRAKAGQSQALSQLIAKYQDRIYNLAYRFTGSDDMALDLSQETFLKCIQALNTFAGKSSFYTWLVRILINAGHDLRRKNSRNQAIQLDGQVADWLAARQRNNPTERNSLETQELQEMVWQGMAGLDQQHRQILLLRELEGFDYSQLSEILEISIGTVKSRLHRARAALRELLLPYLCED